MELVYKCSIQCLWIEHLMIVVVEVVANEVYCLVPSTDTRIMYTCVHMKFFIKKRVKISRVAEGVKIFVQQSDGSL